MQARHLLTAAAISVAAAACQPQAQQEPAKPKPPVILVEADVPPRPMKPGCPASTRRPSRPRGPG